MIQVTYGPKIDYALCNGCKACYNICPLDVFGWDDENNRPIILYPEECHHDGICEMECPELAITHELPLQAKYFLSIYP